MGRSTLILYLFVALFSGCYNSFEAAPTSVESQQVEYNITIELLAELLSSQEYIDVEDDVVICGSVTANDVGGNLYNSFFIEQDGYAVEVLEGLNYNYVRYPEGSVVVVSLDGLRLARRYGVLQVGVAGAVGSLYDLDFMGHQALVDRHITNSGVVRKVEPLLLTLEELYSAAADYGSMCGRLVSIEGVRFESERYEVDDRRWSGSRTFVDMAGRRMGCYTSPYAYYSALDIEDGYATITGILEYGSVDGARSVMLKMRSLSDYSVEK